MSPSPGCHPLRDVTHSGMSPALGCHPLQGATRCRAAAGRFRAPPCPSAAAKLQSSREGSGCSCAQVLLQIFHSCARCTAARRPAGVVSCLLHYSSLAQRLGRAAVGCWGPGAPSGWPGSSPRRHVGACGRRVLEGSRVARWVAVLGERGALREVMHPRSLSPAVAAGHRPCCSGKARSHKTPQTPWEPRAVPSSQAAKHRSGADLAPPRPLGQALGSPRGELQAPSSRGAGTGPSVPSGGELVSAALHLLGQPWLCAPLPRGARHRAEPRHEEERKNTEGRQPAAGSGSPANGALRDGHRGPPERGGLLPTPAGWERALRGLAVLLARAQPREPDDCSS